MKNLLVYLFLFNMTEAKNFGLIVLEVIFIIVSLTLFQSFPFTKLLFAFFKVILNSNIFWLLVKM